MNLAFVLGVGTPIKILCSLSTRYYRMRVWRKGQDFTAWCHKNLNSLLFFPTTYKFPFFSINSTIQTNKIFKKIIIHLWTLFSQLCFLLYLLFSNSLQIFIIYYLEYIPNTASKKFKFKFHVLLGEERTWHDELYEITGLSRYEPYALTSLRGCLMYYLYHCIGFAGLGKKNVSLSPQLVVFIFQI